MGKVNFRFTGLPPNAIFSDDGFFQLLNKVPGKDCVVHSASAMPGKINTKNATVMATGEQQEQEEEEHTLTIDTAGMLLRFPVGV